MTSGHTMCPYGLHTHVVMNGISNYKHSHGCSHICHVLAYWYHNGYHGFQGELGQGALKGTFVLPIGNPPPPPFGVLNHLGGCFHSRVHLYWGPPPPFEGPLPFPSGPPLP
jgi:hypothetical protein